MLGYDRLFAELGPLTEPYVKQFLPHLLSSFGDSKQEITAATEEATKTLMEHLSQHGVRIVLPLVLTSLQDKKVGVHWKGRGGV